MTGVNVKNNIKKKKKVMKLNKDIKDILKYLVPAIVILTFIMMFFSCRSIQEVPVQTIEKVIYKDTLVYVHDSIRIEVPYETVKENILVMDTSYLKTSIAESTAYVDTLNKRLFHTLTQKGELETVHDTVVKFTYIDKLIEKEVPVEVEVIKYKRDALFWSLAGWALLCGLLIALKLFVLK